LPGLAEEIRDLNLFSNFFRYHRQGEITAKLAVPRRQIEHVVRFDRNLNPEPASWPGGRSSLLNRDFVFPDCVSNVIEEIN
jgi:hypothetical protein